MGERTSPLAGAAPNYIILPMFHSRVLLVFSAVFAATALLGACAGDSAMNAQVRSRAASDLNCHQSAIEFVEDKPLEKRVRGCGQALVYSRSCAGGDPNAAGSCQWIARQPEDDSDEVAAAPTAEQSFEGETTVEAEKVSD